MRESDYYPAGAYNDPSAPYNEKRVPERDFQMNVEYVMRKERVTVTTDDYIPEYEEETGNTYTNTDNTDWETVYNECSYGIPELLKELECYIEQDLERHKGNRNKERHLREMLEDCKGWEVYDKSFEEA